MGKKFDKVEKVVGNIGTVILIGVIVFSILATIFRLLFRDGRGVSLYGNRGSVYMYDDYDNRE